ncbi:MULTISPECIES: formate--tetrahydrofolate ligase [unclassified Beijerinckia]|uniref:formate--tetrahydrofolate ligase n=1 Tax=unclassified Beijerinckia TaxID=2638183 RepID=UPI0008952B80|nr:MULTISPECIES: formate--tetrahydrofolate ligase [unclassified Beijerinckia]MDH7796809.1 formate--tetrahydrofolate ligase [Beijerinckia sp. GAS462]SEC60728.1 Formate-tetrahydrofolate ligase [Beijerinckia sp. 28-YEA-48]
MKPDIEIARSAKLAPIADIAAKLGISAADLHPYGKYIAKIDLDYLHQTETRPLGRLVLVTAISPTPAGEGKTTTTVGLGDGLSRLGKRAAICLREPSLGPCFGMKGGAAGGGFAQVVPMESINLHFTGDFHAIGAAHNLLAALLDNHIYWGNGLGIDQRRVVLRRVMDMNDRALRQIVSSLGGVANGFPREDGFDITVASEVMAIFCLAKSIHDLEARLARMIVAYTREHTPITSSALKAPGGMAVLLKDALAPNLVQSLEGTPAFVHGGPFANIAHGCNSVMATTTALRHADYVVTEAGFGADLGAEKFFDIKCRSAGLTPSAAVVVATVRALKMHGGVARADLTHENIGAIDRGFANLARHITNLRAFGVPPVVAINRFATDTDAELHFLVAACRERLGVDAEIATHFADGSRGSEAMARAVVKLCESGAADFRPLYPDNMPLVEKIRTIARKIYGAADIVIDAKVADDLKTYETMGFGNLPVCIAKTQYSFSTDPTLRGAPSGHMVPVREVRLSAGAGFVVAICGDIMTMPGLPREPAAEHIGLDAHGLVQGLF